MVCVGLCWARVGTILGLSWAISGYVGTYWAMLALYWAMSSSHTIFHHTIFHTQLCHTPSFATPSFTHHFVTHHLSHTALSHALFHTQLSHTPSFTHNCVTHTHTLSFFVTHHLSHTTLSHTTFFYFSILHHLLCLSFLPSPFVAHCWKKLACGVIRSFICVFVCLFLCSLLFWWHHTGLMLNNVEPFWVIFRYLLAFFWDLDISVLLSLVLLAFILDLGISVLLSFGLVTLYFGLGHFNVVELWSCWPFFWTWAFQCR